MSLHFVVNIQNSFLIIIIIINTALTDLDIWKLYALQVFSYRHCKIFFDKMKDHSRYVIQVP